MRELQNVSYAYSSRKHEERISSRHNWRVSGFGSSIVCRAVIYSSQPHSCFTIVF